MAEYYVDLTINNDVEEWLLLQGATVRASENMDWRGGTWKRERPDVFFGGRKIHYYAGQVDQARIFFNDETKGAAIMLLLKWPDIIFKTNLPREIA